MDIKKIIAERIRQLRKEKGLTHKDLANMLNCTSPCISSFECGRNNIATKYLVELAGIFGVTTDYLLGMTNERVSVETISEYAGLPNEYVEKLHEIYMLTNNVDVITKFIDMQIQEIEENELEKVIGSNVRKLRKKRGLTVQKLAELIGVASSTIYSIERGERKLKLQNLQFLAKYFNKDVDWFSKYHLTV